jgi:ribosomal protein S18 acetylase RimI-like enzyme
MSAAGLLSTSRTFSGLRPVNLHRDLAGIADLIEVCFASTLDAGGRAAIQEMRAVSRSRVLLGLLIRLGQAVPFMRGFVWVEGERVIGNVSVSPTDYGNGWIIANVAVYPEFRQQGIARQLMHSALEMVAKQGKFATLQVDADNPSARHLYETLGFQEQRTFIRWRRMSHLRTPDCQGDVTIRQLARREAGALYDLASRVRPNLRGGMGWLRPTRIADLRPSWLGDMRFWLKGEQSDFWVVPGRAGHIEAALIAEHRMGSSTGVFDLLVSPEQQGVLEAPLINYALCSLFGRHQPVVTDHPADDAAASDVLYSHYFKPERTLVHMIRPVAEEENR